MAQLSRIALSNFSSNPEKIYFSSLEESFTGKDCLQIINYFVDTFRLSEKNSIGIYSSNDIFWPLIYLAADLTVKEIYIFHSNTKKEHVEEYKSKYNIDFIYSEEVFDKTLLKKIKNMVFDKLVFSKKMSRSDILFTSGTTGMPKGVRILENSFLHVANLLRRKLDQSSFDTELLSMPFGHSFGLVRLRCVLLAGSSCVITNGLRDFPAIYKLSESKTITGLSFVPAALEIVKGLLRKKAKNFGQNIRYIELGSSFLSEETNEWLAENFPNTNVIHHYGMTEASRAFLRPRGKNDVKDLPSNWIGQVLEGCEYKLRPTDDYANKQEIEGELLLRGKNLFSGYLDDEAFDQSLDWLPTKDVCAERDGNLFLIGRTDNQYNIGGEKIQAEDIENRISHIEGVKDAVAFQISDKILGNKLGCIIQLQKNCNSHQYLNNQLNQSLNDLQGFLRPRYFVTYEDLVKTANGKKIREEDTLNKYLSEEHVSELTN